jgi:hypothetical protein
VTALLQGRFDSLISARYALFPAQSKLKWPSLAISPWQNRHCEATLMGEKSKERSNRKMP